MRALRSLCSWWRVLAWDLRGAVVDFRRVRRSRADLARALRASGVLQ